MKHETKKIIVSSIISAITTLVVGLIILYFTKSFDTSLEKKAEILIEKELKSQSDTNENLSINYMRLFGCYRIGMVLNNIENHLGGGYSSNELESFMTYWNNCFKDAMIVKSEVLLQLYDNDSTIYTNKNTNYNITSFNCPDQNKINYSKLVKIACKNDSIASICANFIYDYLISDIDKSKNNLFNRFINNSDEIDDWGENEKDLFCQYYEKYHNSHDYSSEEIWMRYLNCTNNIGYLILIIENTSKCVLNDVVFKYNYYPQKFNSYKDINDTNLFSMMDTNIIYSKTIPYLKPEQKLIWLVSIYEIDNKGYPKKYISSIIHPCSISYRIKGKKLNISESIRLPLKDYAQKVFMPYGWYCQ